MGCNLSKNEHDKEKVELDIFLNKYMPIFLQSEYCNIQEKEWIEPIVFWVAFQSYLHANKINIPQQMNRTNIEFVKYYFHQLYDKKDIYVTGSCKYNILVGVSIGKWPGTKETDNRAIFECQLPKYPF